MVVEVLSESTEGKDRFRKANFYRACPTIQEYMLIATRYQAVEVLRRTGDQWTFHVFALGNEVELVSIGIHFPLATLYQGTTIPEVPNDQV